jgi:hypothetical protein
MFILKPYGNSLSGQEFLQLLDAEFAVVEERSEKSRISAAPG